jgi:hypothetical protein
MVCVHAVGLRTSTILAFYTIFCWNFALSTIYILRGKNYFSFFSKNDPWIVLFPPKCKIMSPFALKLPQKENKKFLKSCFLWIFKKFMQKFKVSTFNHHLHLLEKYYLTPWKYSQIMGGGDTPSQNLGLAGVQSIYVDWHSFLDAYSTFCCIITIVHVYGGGVLIKLNPPFLVKCENYKGALNQKP